MWACACAFVCVQCLCVLIWNSDYYLHTLSSGGMAVTLCGAGLVIRDGTIINLLTVSLIHSLCFFLLWQKLTPILQQHCMYVGVSVRQACLSVCV